MRTRLIIPATLLALTIAATEGRAQSLRPSGRSMTLQTQQARLHDFTYLRDAAHVRHFVNKGWLVPLGSNPDYKLKGVSFPYARPETRLFVERLGRQYRAACGERLVVTSATRPRNRQPRNASPNSVHQTGMAIDLRRSSRRSCRTWLERVLLSLESRRVLEASLEWRPAHYHVALFPAPYARYVKSLNRKAVRHAVRAGDNLTRIAKRYGTSVSQLRRVNGLRSDRIYPGQVLAIPGPS